MTHLDKKRKELEIIKVKAARHELEFRILEKEDEILRLRDNIKIQDDFITKAENDLKEHSLKK